MLKKIKKKVFNNYQKQEKKGVFFSGYSKQDKLILSKGILQTDKKLKDLIDDLYHGILKEHIEKLDYIGIDIVKQPEKLNNPDQILSTNPKKYGFCIKQVDKENSGVILPNTKSVPDAKHALNTIKKKYDLEKNVNVYRFQTDRIVVN